MRHFYDVLNCIFQSFQFLIWTFQPNLLYIHTVYQTLGTPSPLLPSEQSQFVGAWTIQGVESTRQGCWLMLTPMLPTVVSSWLYVLWVVDHSWYTKETVEHEKPSSVVVLTQTVVHGTYYHIPFKGTSIFLSCPFTLWTAHIHNLCLFYFYFTFI